MRSKLGRDAPWPVLAARCARMYVCKRRIRSKCLDHLTSSIWPPGLLGSCQAAQKKAHAFPLCTAVSYSASVLISTAPRMVVSAVFWCFVQCAHAFLGVRAWKSTYISNLFSVPPLPAGCATHFVSCCAVGLLRRPSPSLLISEGKQGASRETASIRHRLPSWPSIQRLWNLLLDPARQSSNCSSPGGGQTSFSRQHPSKAPPSRPNRLPIG